MNWDAIAAIGELLGSVGVLVTLVYLALQIRQNTASLEDNKRFAQAQVYQARANAVNQMVKDFADPSVMSKLVDPDNPEAGINYDRVLELDLIDRMKIGQFLSALDTHGDNVEMQRSLGLLSADDMELTAHNQSHEWLYQMATRLGFKLRPGTKTGLERAGYDVSNL